MKRFILISLLCLPVFVLADDCSDTYKTGVDFYKAGEYTEAQRKFIAVAKVCGNYSNVYQYLKDCNAKLSDKQSTLEKKQNLQASEILSLKKENKNLKEEKRKLEIELDTIRNSRNKMAVALVNSRGVAINNVESKEEITAQLKQAKDTINVLRNDTARLHHEIMNLQENKKIVPTPVVEGKRPLIKLFQPNGVAIHIHLLDNQMGGIAEDDLIIKEGRNGWYVYAIRNKKGNIISSRRKAYDANMRSAKDHKWLAKHGVRLKHKKN